MKNYYAILGLSLAATAEEIKLAYKQNAKKYHPDLNPGSESHNIRFLEIKEAYEILSNPNSKREYDRQVAALRARSQTLNSAQQRSAGGQTVQQSAQSRQTAQQRQAFNQPPPPRQGVNNQMLEQMKALYIKQIEVLKAQSQKEAAELKKSMFGQLDAYKKQYELKYKQAYEQLKAKLEKAQKVAKHYKSTYKKNSFNAGYLKGAKEKEAEAERLRDSVQETEQRLEQLRKEKSRLEADYMRLTETAAMNTGNSDNESVKLRLREANNTIHALYKEKAGVEEELVQTQYKLKKLQLDLERSEQKCAGLNTRVEQLIAADMEEDTANNADIERLNKIIGDLEGEINVKDELVARQAKEIKALNDEVLHLEGYLQIWKDSLADGEITQEELARINDYENEQRRRAENTLYGTLGVYLNALDDEIEEAYLRLKGRYEGRDEYIDKYIAVVEAFNTLSDAAAKKEYDASINNDLEF